MYSYDSVCIDIGEFYRAQEFVIDAKLKCNYPNGRKCYGLIYCIDGEAEFSFSNGNKSRLQKGEAILIFPKTAYVVTTKSGCHHYTVNFDINHHAVQYLINTRTAKLMFKINKRCGGHLQSKINVRS